MSTNANHITAYLMLYLNKEIQGLDVWRSNRYNGPAIRAGGKVGRINAGINGQADITGHYGDMFPPNNRRIEIEVKGPGDTLGPSQKDFQLRCQLHGTLYMVCDIPKIEYVEAIRVALKLKPPAARPTVTAVQVFIDELRYRILNHLP
jgi:hypothetical protein